MSNADVMKMLQAGVSKVAILAAIKGTATEPAAEHVTR
jgi:hypothetical protein